MDKNRTETIERLERELSEVKEKVAGLENILAQLKLEEGSPAEHIDLGHEDFLADITEVSVSEDSIVNEPVTEELKPVPAPVQEDIPAVEEQEQEDLPEVAPAAAETEPEDVPEDIRIEHEDVAEDIPEAVEPEDIPEDALADITSDEKPAAESDEPEESTAEEEDLPEGDDGSLFGMLEEEPVNDRQKPVRTLNDANSSRVHKTVGESRGAQAWRTDIPGPEVKDIRSAISLNDRVMFISTLFREDSMLFQDVVSRINAQASLDKVVSYLEETFPEWDMNSDLVYRFMMAVRRKIR